MKPNKMINARVTRNLFDCCIKHTQKAVGLQFSRSLSKDEDNSETVYYSGEVTTDDGQQKSDVSEIENPSKLKKHDIQKTIRLTNNNVIFDDMKPVTTTDIKHYLQKCDMAFSEGYTCFMTTCPRFVKRRIKLKEVNKMYINMTTGYFVCLSCKKSGSWSNFKDNTETLLSVEKVRMPECFKDTVLEDMSKERQKARDLWETSLLPSEVSEEELTGILHLLGTQGLKKSTFERYNVRVKKEKTGLVLPHFGLDGDLIGVKTIAEEVARAADGKETARVVTRTIPRVDFHGLFGLNTVKQNQVEVVLTATEFDALAVYQSAGITALALPKNDSILPQKVLPLLEQFQKITLWFGGNMKMWESIKQFSWKLNDSRCHLVRPEEGHPSAVIALQKNLKVTSILKDAKSVKHKSIISFRNRRQDVFAELSQTEQVAGVKWQRYPHLNKLLKGHRRGELTVFTGPTGSGKTTFISDYSLDLSMQGVNTLWGSFEINNVRLMKTMLFQYSQTNLVKHLKEFDYWADRFEQLPMYFMTFHGHENVRRVIETMSHAVYVHDIAHVIVDNLQFMLGTEDFGSNPSVDRFYKQDQTIGAFRKFATNMNCHITLVIHPRKERETEELGISSIFGSAKATQEADNVMIIQDRRAISLKGRKYLQLVKNRYDGELGVMALKFDKDTLSFMVKPKDQDKSKAKTKDPGKSSNLKGETSENIENKKPQYYIGDEP